MSSKSYDAWLKVGFDTWMLGTETASVVALRTARIATGGSEGTAEVELMVTEKVQAAMELQTRLMIGTLGLTPLSAAQGALKHYRHKVAANNRRLSRRVKTS